MIDVIATAREAFGRDMHGVTAVVIDVLRATTTMTVALHNGASRILAVRSSQEAFDIKTQLSDDVLLGGERNADLIPGFDLDNSPRGYTSDVVAGKTIVMTTTNGTEAIHACRDASRILVASLLNVDKIAEQIVDDNVAIVCAGTEGKFTMEDGLCAGALVARLQGAKSDFAVAMEQLYLSSQSDIKRIASLGEHFNRLLLKGYGADLDICFDSSRHYDAIECVKNEIIMIR